MTQFPRAEQWDVVSMEGAEVAGGARGEAHDGAPYNGCRTSP